METLLPSQLVNRPGWNINPALSGIEPADLVDHPIHHGVASQGLAHGQLHVLSENIGHHIHQWAFETHHDVRAGADMHADALPPIRRLGRDHLPEHDP